MQSLDPNTTGAVVVGSLLFIVALFPIYMALFWSAEKKTVNVNGNDQSNEKGTNVQVWSHYYTISYICDLSSM
jgi:hypothetical protein